MCVYVRVCLYVFVCMCLHPFPDGEYLEESGPNEIMRGMPAAASYPWIPN